MKCILFCSFCPLFSAPHSSFSFSLFLDSHPPCILFFPLALPCLSSYASSPIIFVLFFSSSTSLFLTSTYPSSAPFFLLPLLICFLSISYPIPFLPSCLLYYQILVLVLLVFDLAFLHFVDFSQGQANQLSP